MKLVSGSNLTTSSEFAKRRLLRSSEVNKYRVNFIDLIMRINNANQHLSDEQFFNLTQNLLINWVHYENTYFSPDSRFFNNTLKGNNNV